MQIERQADKHRDPGNIAECRDQAAGQAIADKIGIAKCPLPFRDPAGQFGAHRRFKQRPAQHPVETDARLDLDRTPDIFKNSV